MLKRLLICQKLLFYFFLGTHTHFAYSVGGGFAVGVWECVFDWWAKLFFSSAEANNYWYNTLEIAVPEERGGERFCSHRVLRLSDNRICFCSGAVVEKTHTAFHCWICTCNCLSPKAVLQLWSVKDVPNTKAKIQSFGDFKTCPFIRERNLVTYET